MSKEYNEFKDDFNYFDDEHFVVKVIEGTCKHCMNIFNQELVSYPNMSFGTHIVYRSNKDLNGICKIVIKRFKTKELCFKHCHFPPTYVRTGKSI